jgi:hypothetical protein
MKKIFQCLVVLIVCLLVIPAGRSKAEPKKISIEISVGDPTPIINGEKQPPLEIKPYIKNNRCMVPLRFISEQLSIKVIYEPETKLIHLQSSKIAIGMYIGYEIILINGKTAHLDTPPELKNNRTIVPLRFFSETFGATVSWDPALYKATILYEIPEN